MSLIPFEGNSFRVSLGRFSSAPIGNYYLIQRLAKSVFDHLETPQSGGARDIGCNVERLVDKNKLAYS